MMSLRRLLAPAVAVAILLSPAVVAQESEAPTMSKEDIEAMNAWMKLAQPGDHHQHLSRLVGSWKGDVTMWMSPEAEPMRDVAEAEVGWVLGDRFLEWKLTGSFQGSPFEGISYEGHNNGNGRYETIWLDNFGTLMLLYTGECSDDGKIRVLSSSFTNPMTGAQMENRVVYTIQDDGNVHYESFIKEGDVEYRNLEIRWTRQ